jgi:hypothetical protein
LPHIHGIVPISRFKIVGVGEMPIQSVETPIFLVDYNDVPDFTLKGCSFCIIALIWLRIVTSAQKKAGAGYYDQ